MPEYRESIAPTYDSRETGPRYKLTVRLAGRTLNDEEPMDDPFVRTQLTIGVRDLLRGLLRGELHVTFKVDADPALVEDVLELDANYLGPSSSRRREFNKSLKEALHAHIAEEEV